MKKILLSLLTSAGVWSVSAAVPSSDALQLSPEAKQTVALSSTGVPAVTLKIESVPDFAPALASGGKTLRSDVTWSEWSELCTTSFPQESLDFIAAVCKNYGTTMPEFTQPFSVERRTASDGSSQLCFKKVFNNVDILIDVMADGSFVCEATTGIAIPDAPADWNREFHVYMVGMYLEGGRKLRLNSFWLMLFGNTGYNIGATDIPLGEAPEFIFFPDKTRLFVPSNRSSAVITVTRSPEVAFYRVVARETGKMTYDELYKIIGAVPGDGNDGLYTDVTENSVEIPVEYDQTNVFLVPYNSERKPLDTYSTCTVYYHRPVEGTWRSLGRGVLRDALVYSAISPEYRESLGEITEGVTTSVEIEVCEEDANLIRVKNPYTASHPLASGLTFMDEGGEDDFYIVFDISDPSRVVVRKGMTGVAGEYGGDIVILESRLSKEDANDRIDVMMGHMWGKYADSRVIMPYVSLAENTSISAAFDFLPAYVLELPGYVDYDVDVTSFSLDADGNAVGVISGIPSSVTSVAYALVPSDDFNENGNFMERYVERFADGMDDRFQIRTVQTEGASEVTVTVSSFFYNGHYRLVAVSQDAQGVCHHAAASANEITKVPPVTEWTDYGKAKVIDSSVMAAFNGAPIAEMVVDVKVCPGMPGLLYIPDYYCKWAEATGRSEWYNAEDAEPYFINATNPNFVFVTPNADGSRANRPMKTGMNVNPAYATVCLMNYSDYNTGSEGAGRASYASLPSGELESIQSVYFNDGPLLCAVYDNAGNFLGGQYGQTEFLFGYDPSTDMSLVENWYDLGWVDVTENIALSRTSDETSEFKASIRQAPFDEDLYALVDLYRNMNHPTIKQLDYTQSQPLFVKFGPDNTVWLSTSYDGDLASGEAIWETGLLYSGVPISVCLMANAVRMEMINGEGFNEQDYYGTYQEGELILDDCLWSYDDGYIQPATNATFRIRLPRSGVESAVVAADEDAPVEYYNLQGVRVAHPSGGIFIRRQGAQVTKVYVK